MGLTISSLLASIEAPEFSSLHLSGEMSTADIIRAAEDQFGIRVRLPEAADDKDRSNYNHIISLKQLVDAIKVKYSSKKTPLSHRFEAGELIFSRIVAQPQPTPKRKTVAPAKTRTPPISQPKYPVPVISQRFPDNDSNPVAMEKNAISQPVLPNWAQQQKSMRSPTANKRIYPPLDTGFEVQIPNQKKTKVSITPLPTPTLTPSIPPRSHQGTTRTSPRVSNSPGYASPYPRSSTSRPTAAGRGLPPTSSRSFGITPYPEDAVGFFNDAPSIVPSASRESFIEWSTRIEGALEQGNHAVLDKEEKELLRRLRWLQNNKP